MCGKPAKILDKPECRVHQTHFLSKTDTSQRVGEAGLVCKHVQRHFHVCDIMLSDKKHQFHPHTVSVTS